MTNLKNVKEYIRALEHMLAYFKSILDEEKRVTPAPATPDEKLAELTDLRMLTKSNIWPEAIEEALVASDTEEGKNNRAEGIIEFMNANLKGKKFLDYGCGEGHVARRAVDHGAVLSVGYDPIVKDFSTPGLILTSKPLTEGDFDVVLLYDVLDHTDDPVTILKLINRFKKTEGEVHVRCHPWTSRHGTHLYRKLNKAYLQLIFTPQELLGMGLKGDKTTRLIDPIKTYKEWFKQAGLEIVVESTIKQDVETFFTTRPTIVRRIKENWWGSADPDLASGKKFPHEAMQIQFADFVLV
jgi:2-polyprenyl-3-methyl-5-hydroxy-6-metoxy-1,4-benzoquinol methylase